MKLQQYDDNELILDLVEGRLSTREIAAKHGIRPDALQRLQSGQSRPTFKARLDLAREAARQEMSLRASGLARELILTHYRVGKEGPPEEARLCREFLLNLFMPEECLAARRRFLQKQKEARKAARLRQERAKAAPADPYAQQPAEDL